MAQLKWKLLHPRMRMEHLGFIPAWLDDSNPESAREQLDTGYTFGGWQPFGVGKWHMSDEYGLTYPGDPTMAPLAMTELRGEVILFYPHAWVAVVQPDKSFEVCRMD